MIVAVHANFVTIGEDLPEYIRSLDYPVRQDKERGFCAITGETFKNLRRYLGGAVIECDGDSSAMPAN